MSHEWLKLETRNFVWILRAKDPNQKCGKCQQGWDMVVSHDDVFVIGMAEGRDSAVLLNMEVGIRKRAWHTCIRYTLLIYDH